MIKTVKKNTDKAENERKKRSDFNVYRNMPLYRNPYSLNTPMQQIQQAQQQQANVMFPQSLYQQTSQNYQQIPPNYQQIIGNSINSQQTLTCEIVGDFETVKAAQINLDGQPKYYPLSDGTAVYRKQLMADGASKIFKYELSVEDNVKQAENVNLDFTETLKELTGKIDRINETVNQISNMRNTDTIGEEEGNSNNDSK